MSARLADEPMAHVMNRFWRLLIFFGLMAASLALAEAELGRGEPFCGQRGSIYWCALTAADARSVEERTLRGPVQVVK